MISFSSITDRPKTNLDDVSDWYITNTIIKDPVKGITTRRIIKVGENNDLLDAEDESTDRNDAILQFSRNVNPMVSVQYNNTGGGFGRSGRGRDAQAFLPYRVMKDGAFRPPIVDQRDLMPLSRQPRNTTSINTAAEFIDYSKGIKPSEDALKRTEVLNTLRTVPMCSNRGYNFKTGMDEPYDVVYHIDNKAQRIKQAMYGNSGNVFYGETPDGYSGDNIGKDIIDGVTATYRNPFVSVEGFVPPPNSFPSSNRNGKITTFRDEINGMLEGSSGRTPMARIDPSWYQHPNMQFKDVKNLNVVTNANGDVTRDNVNRTEREQERNMPLCSVAAPKSYRGLTHFNYVNGKEEHVTTTGLVDPKKQRQTYGFGNDGQGGGGTKPMTIQRSMNNKGLFTEKDAQLNSSFGTKTVKKSVR